MKVRMGLLAGVLLLSVAAFADKAPVVNSIDPVEADPGALVTATGVALTKANVSAVYLSNGATEVQVELLEQTAQTLKFKVPENLRGGRYTLVLAMPGDPPLLLEQPVKLFVTGPLGEP